MADILVIDDEPENQLLIRMILECEGYRVTVRDDGASGLEAARHGDYDLILLDVMMPDLNGLEVFQRLQESANTRHVPVVMLTALAQRRDYEQAARLGVRHYLTKPFEPTELLTRVREVLADRP